LNCPQATGCDACALNYETCVESNPTNLCPCVSDYSNCLTTQSCGVSGDVLCSSYSSLCPSLNCPPATGCTLCDVDYSSCAIESPGSICTCLESYYTCSTQNSCGLTEVAYESVCPIYQSLCPSIPCTVNATGCVACSVTYSSCALSAIKTDSIDSVCTCISTMFNCLSGATCGLAPYNGLCGVYSSFCPNMQCSSNSVRGQASATQVTALIQQYSSEISQYIENALAVSVNFGAITASGNAQIVQLQLIYNITITQEELTSNLLNQFAQYFKIAQSRLELDISTKRSQDLNGELVVNPPSGTSQLTISLVFVVMIILSVLFVA